MKYVIAIILLLANQVYATTAIYTLGDPQSYIIAKTLFAESTVIPKPGGEGAILWREFIQSKESVSIQPATTVHLNNSENTNKVNLIGVISVSSLAIVSRYDSKINSINDLKGNTFSIGTISENGICALLVKKLQQQHNLNLLLVPYKTPFEVKSAFLGKQIDLACTPGTFVNAYKNTNTGKVVLDLTKHYGVPLRTYMFSTKDLGDSKKHALIQNMNRQLSETEITLLANNDIYLDVHTGTSAVKIFNTEQLFFNALKAK